MNPLDAALRPIALARHEIMQRVQLKNLKWRAEALARSREASRRSAQAEGRESDSFAGAQALRAG